MKIISRNRIFKEIVRNLVSVVILILFGNLIAFIIEPGFIKYPKLFLWNSYYSIIIGYPLMKGNEIIAGYFGRKFEWEKTPFKRIIFTILAVILFSSICTLIINYIFFLLKKEFIFSFFSKTFHVILIQIFIIIYIFSVITGIELFNLWKKSLMKQELLQRKAIELQLEALKNQVNPHFLFNSLNCLTSLIWKDQEQAVQFVIQLSDIYRYVLENKGKNTVDWLQEKEFTENYLNLQKIRFADSLKFIVDVKVAENIQVVPLSVQMSVENAIKHNIITEDKPLYINIYFENDFLVVRNNLQPKNMVIDSENIGIQNITMSYELLAGKKPEIMDADGFFTVKLPVIYSQNK